LTLAARSEDPERHLTGPAKRVVGLSRLEIKHEPENVETEFIE